MLASVVSSCKAEVSDLCCYMNPCRMFPLHPVMSATPNKIKALVEMGHPPTSCVFVERTLRVGAVSVDIRVLVHVFTCPVRWSRRCACACEGACVLECGLTFNFDTTGSICAPQGEVMIFSRENRQERKSTVGWLCSRLVINHQRS